MKDENKTKKQLIEELKKLRRQNQLNKKAESERKEAEKELRESEQFSKNIINSMTDGFSILDEQGVHIDVNPAFCKMIGFKKEELIGVGPPHPYWPEEEYENIQKAFKKTTQGKFDEFKLVFKKKSGERFPVMVSPSQITDSKGNVTSIFATIKDITKSRKAEKELRASEKRFEDIALSSGDWIWEVDVDGKYTFASGRVEQILGYTPEELIGKAPFELMPEKESQRVGKIFEEIAAAKKPIIDLENKNLSKKGDLVYLLTNGVPIIDSNGNLTGYRGVDKDITERKKTEEEIKIRNQVAKVFLSVSDKDMYADVLNIILESLDSKYGIFGYINEKGDHVVPSMTRRVWDQCEVKEKDIIFPKETWGKSSWARAIREKKPNYSNKKSKLVPKGHVPIIRHMSMPIVHRGECIGLLQVANKKTDYDQRDLELLQNIADYIAPVLKARLQRDRQEKERKQAEEELRHSEKRYRSYIEVTGQLGWSTNAKGEVVEDIPTWRAYTGQSYDEMKGWGWTEAIHPEDRERTSEIWREAIKTKSKYETEFRVRGKDGKYRWFLSRALPFLDEKGNVLEWIGTCIDIHDIKQAQQALQESEEKYRKLYESMMDAFISTDMEGQIVEYNQEFLDMLRYTEEEIKKLTYIDLTPEKWHEMESQIVEDQILKKGYSDVYQKEYIKKDGTVIPVELRVFLLKDKEGKPSGMWAIVRDITERKKAEQELQLHSKLLTHMDEGVYLVRSRDGTIVYTNPAFTKMFGYKPDELIGKNVSIVNAPTQKDPEERAKEIIDERNKSGKWEGEVKNIKKDGTPFWCHATVSTFEHHEYGPVWISVHTDITDIKKAEEELHHLNQELASKNKELEQVLYATSHDLRSPLVNVQGFNRELQASLQELNSLLKSQEISETLKNKLKPLLEEDIPESLKYILTSTSKMDLLLSGLLSLSRLGRQKLAIKNLDMDKLLKDVVSTFEYEIKEKNIELELSPLPDCRGDELQINQVFSNLLGNAVKFIDPDRTSMIKISGKKKKDLVHYSVEDNGIGIPSNLQAKIFELFHKLDTKTPGIGLGLTIVKQILDKHNGNIQIHSKKGKGTRITVSLPAKYKGD